jgi:hypothetical protein
MVLFFAWSRLPQVLHRVYDGIEPGIRNLRIVLNCCCTFSRGTEKGNFGFCRAHRRAVRASAVIHSMLAHIAIPGLNGSIGS